MTDVFVRSLAKNFREALDTLERALTDCPDEFWRRICGRTRRRPVPGRKED